MADLTPAELSLLGLLAEKPRHGYELAEVIEARGMRQWTEIGFSSIYYLLGKLHDRGLIAEVDRPVPSRGGKARKVFAPTTDGEVACAEATEAALAELRPVFSPVLIGLANQPVLPPERVRAALDHRAAALSGKIAEVQRAADADAPSFVRAIFDHALAQLTAEQAWLSAYRASLAAASGQGDE